VGGPIGIHLVLGKVSGSEDCVILVHNLAIFSISKENFIEVSMEKGGKVRNIWAFEWGPIDSKFGFLKKFPTVQTTIY